MAVKIRKEERASHPPKTEFLVEGGNEFDDAEKRLSSGFNASEGIEPRNCLVVKADLVSIRGRQHRTGQ